MSSADHPEPQADPYPGNDGAPAPTREALISTAIKFLQNPKVRHSPLATRKAFLKKKGLTNEEVDLVIQRSGTTEEVLPLTTFGPPHPLDSSHLATVPHSPKGYRWRDYGAFTIMIVGIAYGCHQLYKKYILPLIMASREDKKHLQRMESNIAAMSGTLTQTVGQLQQTLTSLQELLIQQQQKIQELSKELATAEVSSASSRIVDNQTVGELKAEIVSLKGLLLSRKQFPSTPSVPKIPSWQIPLKAPSASSSQSVNHSSSDISPVSNESANSSPVKDGRHSPQDELGVTNGVNGDDVGLVTGLPLDLKDQVRMEVQGEEQKEEENDDFSQEKEEKNDLSMQTKDRRGGDGQIHEQEDKLKRPEDAGNESEVD
ncbi:peroxisomal membrane protein PEX14 isoform X2 [Dunckerocampus dactyliophorus]|uniref:peroxisomal membrane protein PEX14 isoform X2 n=1 Tax=Dunckerocampus dactyliophorus TaxID=161453 RepID=UPI00240626AF|nr:peroxisomal membrane protein PEX14 isoform X2 [Dunckerocampus dactyliophorus]